MDQPPVERLQAGNQPHRHQPPAARMPRHDPPPSSRWRASATTFGPAGRVVATVVWVGVPCLAFVFLAIPFNVVAFVIWLVLAPRGLRDIWAPAPAQAAGRPSSGVRQQ